MCIIGEDCGFGLVPEQMENLTFRIDTLNHRFCSYTESLKIFFSSSTPQISAVAVSFKVYKKNIM
uniref:Uncharacterized protein n=1 Tax=Anguilla anguilla TaxID=7936 RepID=A0A0E9RCH9_ANGAN